MEHSRQTINYACESKWIRTCTYCISQKNRDFIMIMEYGIRKLTYCICFIGKKQKVNGYLHKWKCKQKKPKEKVNSRHNGIQCHRRRSEVIMRQIVQSCKKLPSRGMNTRLHLHNNKSYATIYL